jgi:hypothetical protein
MARGAILPELKMSDKEKKALLEHIIQRLNPHFPAGVREDAMPRVNRDSSAVRQLQTYVAADPYAKRLLTGHIGVGKSTELAYFAREMQSKRFVIECSVASTLGVHNADTFTLLIVVLEAAIRSWINRLGPMPSGLVQELVGLVRQLLPEGKRPPQPPTTVIEALLDQSRALQEALGKMPKRITTGEQLAKVYSDCLQRLALRYVPAIDLGSIDPTSVARSCEIIIKELSSKAGQSVLLIIDDLDKVREEKVQTSIFLDRAMAWMRLPCAVVATLPFEMYFGARSAELDDVWGEVLVLDPLPVPEENGHEVNEPALKPYLRMLRQADAHKVISALQCRRLSHVSSGLPRAFVYCSSSCLGYVLEAGEDHVRDYHVNLVLQDLTAKWRGRLTDEDYHAIIRVLDSGGSNIRGAAQLLRDGVLIRNSGEPPESQVRPATWAIPLINAYRRRHKVTSGTS